MSPHLVTSGPQVAARAPGIIPVVKDDPATRMLLIALLDDGGLVVIAVENGLDASMWRRERRPVMGMLDRGLPEVSSQSVLLELVSLYNGAPKTIFIVSREKSPVPAL
jgi:DNA-binding response OmpR family regulator